MWQRWIIWIIFLCAILCLLQYTSLLRNIHQAFSKIHYVLQESGSYNSGDFVNLGFTFFEFEQAKLREIELEREYDLTAIVLHWKRLEGVQKTLQVFLNSLIFKQIIVWNNNPQINLTLDHLINNNHSTNVIRIINAKENLKDAAKYRACAEATTRGCFYVDDDWQVTHYIKSLISSFRSDPNVLHSVTDPYTFYTNLVWSYFDFTIDLHTGFSWIGCGSVFLREHAQRHLQLLNKFLVNDSGYSYISSIEIKCLFLALIQLSDVFFSIWLNDIPSQMNTNIQHQPSASLPGSLPFSSTPDFLSRQHRSSVVAIRILEHSLRFDRTNNIDNISFPRQQKRRFPYCVKSPSLNDDFIFYSNVLPFEMQNISFNISRDLERGTRQNLPGGHNVTYFTSHSTSNAVDGVVSTCWRTNRPIHSGDFFAIDFLRAQTNITFILTVAHSSILQRNLDMRISFDGVWWISYRSLKGIFIKMNGTSQEGLHSTLFDSIQFTPGFQSFRYISFKTINTSDQRFQVCEIKIVSKKNIANIMPDFQPLIP
jgi:hypothetical protein